MSIPARYDDDHPFRVWPDSTVQDSDDEPHDWMSDDYMIVWARDEADALTRFKEAGYA